MTWIRYRLHTKSVEDYRPLVFDARYPWWCSGEAGDGSTATIIIFLPKGEDLLKYWDDAEITDADECDNITFTDRFAKPDYFVES